MTCAPVIISTTHINVWHVNMYALPMLLLDFDIGLLCKCIFADLFVLTLVTKKNMLMCDYDDSSAMLPPDHSTHRHITWHCP